MASPQALSEIDRRRVALWAADCAERVLPLFEAEAPGDDRVRDGIDRTRAFGRGDVDTAGEIRRRFETSRAARSVQGPAAVAAVRAAGQASAVAHMGAHALGAAAYAAKAAALAAPGRPGGPEQDDARRAEVRWQLDHISADVRAALLRLPLLGADASGPLGSGLLATGVLATTIREIQAQMPGLTRAG
ncbi:putative immunity protein [Myceligenerans crystallogenes]|uniref:Imm-5-like domain-containing protein n=1 Tax=Myceligenerans crystallogenes TaxID=316335 RepID=A0ABP4ZJD7_9MICO